MMFRFRSYPGLLFAYAHMANLHFAIFHTISRPIFLENGKLSENLMFLRKFKLFNFKKETFNTPSSAQRRKNMVQNHEKPNLSLFRAFGRGICSPPARCRIARAPDHVGGEQIGTILSFKIQAVAVRCKKMQTSEARLADRQPRLRAAQVVVLQIGRGGRGRGHSEQVGKINAGRAPARAADGGPPPPILTPKRAYLKSERFYFPTLGHRPVSENKLFAFCVS